MVPCCFVIHIENILYCVATKGHFTLGKWPFVTNNNNNNLLSVNTYVVSALCWTLFCFTYIKIIRKLPNGNRYYYFCTLNETEAEKVVQKFYALVFITKTIN